MRTEPVLESTESSESPIAEGGFYQKQILCESGLISWSHRSRFEYALSLLPSTPVKVLDYGSGDGTFLAMASPRIESGWGADISPPQVQDCQTRLASFSNLHFSTISELSDPVHTAAYGMVTCMETLEHCTAPIVEVVLSDLARLVAPDGRVIISVPIETGPTFVLKALIRGNAARRGLGDYKYYERYSFPDALRMIFATKSSDIQRPDPTHSHWGFNWRSLRERVRAHFHLERTVFTPVGWLGGYVSSQAWFLCRPRKDVPRT